MTRRGHGRGWHLERVFWVLRRGKLFYSKATRAFGTQRGLDAKLHSLTYAKNTARRLREKYAVRICRVIVWRRKTG